MRLFYAVEFNTPEKEALCAAMERMKPCFIRGRFTPRENLHLTLLFLGATDEARLGGAYAAMDAVTVKRFALCVGGVGFFRQNGAAALCWAGVESCTPLQALHSSLNAALRERGFRTETSPYRPHVTLIRRAALREGCGRGTLTVPVMRVSVEQFSLLRSDLGGREPVYTVLHTKRLEA
jgi:2'-5' RNA ligase